jgi:lipoprotein-releasing system ATP-binding protein
MSPEPTILEARRLAKEYVLPNERVSVLRDIDLVVSKAEMVAVVGPSGSGKSTLLNILGTLDHPTGGTVLLDGADLSQLGDAELAVLRNQHIGFVFQFHHLLPEFSLLENVALPALIGNGSNKERWDRARSLVDRMGLAPRLKHRPDRLSGGEKQRAAVARALVNRPRLILADEPTGNLDVRNGELLMETFLKLRDEEGLTIVLVTHNQSIAARADRVFNLKEGRLHDLR